MNPIAGEVVKNLGEDAAQKPGFVSRADDPVIVPDYSSPADFTAQYPNILDPTEILKKCEEVSLLQFIPEVRTGLKVYTWREMDVLTFTSGSIYIAFQDGYCPEEYKHDGDNLYVTLKNIGVKKSLSYSDILHSQTVAGNGGINALLGPFPGSEGLPGGTSIGTFQREHVANVKEKEIVLGSTLLLNGWDRLLVTGDATTNSLEFNGIEKWQANTSCDFHTGSVADASGTFSAISFDRWLAESCAKPTVLMAHPAAMQELMSAYFQLGYQGSQLVNFNDGNRITPGYNFGSFVNTGVGRLQVVADQNFTRTAISASTFSATIWAFRMTHNGEPLVYRITQIPMALTDLVPGCTAISFEIWAKTALVIKACCAQGQYDSRFSGRVTSVTQCDSIY